MDAEPCRGRAGGSAAVSRDTQPVGGLKTKTAPGGLNRAQLRRFLLQPNNAMPSAARQRPAVEPDEDRDSVLSRPVADAERSVLAAMMLNRQAIAHARALLPPEAQAAVLGGETRHGQSGFAGTGVRP